MGAERNPESDKKALLWRWFADCILKKSGKIGAGVNPERNPQYFIAIFGFACLTGYSNCI